MTRKISIRSDAPASRCTVKHSLSAFGRSVLTLLLGSTLLASTLLGSTATAQSGLRDSLEALDRDGDGVISPDEITPLSRPYLERVAKARRMSLERPNRIDKLQEAARIYYALQNGVAGTSVRASRERSLRSFRPSDDDIVIPEFGLAEVKYRYTADDLDEAEDTIRRYDRDRDGQLDRREASRGRWTHRDPFAEDFNKDDRLSRLELAQRYARRRMLENDSGELVQRARRTGNGIRSSTTDNDKDDRRSREQWWRSGGDRYWLTASLIGRFDANRNGKLEREESTELGVPAGAIDSDQDGVLTREEMFAYFKEIQDQTGDLASGLPAWFYELDENRDKQISLPEYAVELTDVRVDEFVALDTNQDGLLTPAEVLSSAAMTGGTFESREAELLPPKKAIVAKIDVPDSFVISDLNLQLNITHTNLSSLDGFLTGPDGTRIELFTAVGGRDDHFNKTRFDDQASTSIVKARAPFEGSFQPEGLAKKQPGLAAFNGKDIKGTWQLSISCTRSSRFGMLNGWSITARPEIEGPLALTAIEDDALETEAPTGQQAPVLPELGDAIIAKQSAKSLLKGSNVKSDAKAFSMERWKTMGKEEKRALIEERRMAIEAVKEKADGK